VTATLSLPSNWNQLAGHGGHPFTDATHERMRHAIARQAEVNVKDVRLVEEGDREANNLVLVLEISTDAPQAVADRLSDSISMVESNIESESGVDIRVEEVSSTAICQTTRCEYTTDNRMRVIHGMAVSEDVQHMCGEQTWVFGSQEGSADCVCECVTQLKTKIPEPVGYLQTKHNGNFNASHVKVMNGHYRSSEAPTGFPTTFPTPSPTPYPTPYPTPNPTP
jgi:hypothetical protein